MVDASGAGLAQMSAKERVLAALEAQSRVVMSHAEDLPMEEVQEAETRLHSFRILKEELNASMLEV